MNSEPLKSKRAAFNNIKASADDDNFNSPDDGFSSRRNIEVQDRTGKEWKTVYLRNY